MAKKEQVMELPKGEKITDASYADFVKK